MNERQDGLMVRMAEIEVEMLEEIIYLDSTVQSYRESGKEVKKRAQAGSQLSVIEEKQREKKSLHEV